MQKRTKRIWITGSSGAGKSTLTMDLGKHLGLPVYHRDLISWKPDWVPADEEDQIRRVMDMCQENEWIFDGNRFAASLLDGRMDRAQVLIHLEVNRFIGITRVVLRFIKGRLWRRVDLPQGCQEALDMYLIKYILRYPKNKEKRNTYFDLAKEKGIQVYFIKNRSNIKSMMENL